MNLSDLFARVSPLRFWRNRSGLAAIEFAFIAPVMLLFYFGTVEISLMILADRKVTTAASTLGDLTARAVAVTDDDLDDIFEATRLTLQPHDSSLARMRITSVFIDASDGDKVKVDWSYANPIWTPYAAGEELTVPAGLIPTGGSVIFAEVEFDYSAALGYLFTSSSELKDNFYLRPRRVDRIALN